MPMSSARIKTIFGDCIAVPGQLFAWVFVAANTVKTTDRTSANTSFMFCTSVQHVVSPPTQSGWRIKTLRG